MKNGLSKLAMIKNMPKRDPARLTGVKIKIPWVGKAEWNADATERKAAWSLYVELVTRIAILTQKDWQQSRSNDPTVDGSGRFEPLPRNREARQSPSLSKFFEQCFCRDAQHCSNRRARQQSCLSDRVRLRLMFLQQLRNVQHNGKRERHRRSIFFVKTEENLKRAVRFRPGNDLELNRLRFSLTT
jgi:hypothetical protein